MKNSARNNKERSRLISTWPSIAAYPNRSDAFAIVKSLRRVPSDQGLSDCDVHQRGKAYHVVVPPTEHAHGLFLMWGRED